MNILITGCSTGFGYDSAVRFARKGHDVHATMRDIKGRNRPAAEALRKLAKGEDVHLVVHELDVTSDASVSAAMVGLPVFDVLINNAGLGYGGPAESFTSE